MSVFVGVHPDQATRILQDARDGAPGAFESIEEPIFNRKRVQGVVFNLHPDKNPNFKNLSEQDQQSANDRFSKVHQVYREWDRDIGKDETLSVPPRGEPIPPVARRRAHSSIHEDMVQEAADQYQQAERDLHAKKKAFDAAAKRCKRDSSDNNEKNKTVAFQEYEAALAKRNDLLESYTKVKQNKF